MTESTIRKHLWISGLRRSGTTAIWKMFRGLEDFVCFDEPFNPILTSQLPNQHHKKTWDEFIQLWKVDQEMFNEHFEAIYPQDEAIDSLNKREIDYITYLSQRPTVIDFTRVNFKCSQLIREFPEMSLLYLFRSPVAFVSSHIINSENRRFLRQQYYRSMFFSGMIGCNSWGMDDVISTSHFEDLISRLRIRPRKPIRRLRSAEKLLLLWLAARRYSQEAADGSENRVFIGSYEEIIDGTCDNFLAALESVGIDKESLRTSHLIQYSLGFRHNSLKWPNLALNAGFEDYEINSYF